MLAPAALAVAACAGIGIAAFENDMSGREFGRGELVARRRLFFVAIGLLPVLGGAVGGRWDLPSQGVEQPLAFLGRPSTGVARVLWLGDPGAAGRRVVGPARLRLRLTSDELPGPRPRCSRPPARVRPTWSPTPSASPSMAARCTSVGCWRPPACATSSWWMRWPPPLVGRRPRSVSAPPPPGLNTDLLEQDDLQVVPGVPRRAGLRERGRHAGDGGTCRGVAECTPLPYPEPGGRGGLATGAQLARGRRAGDRIRAAGHPLCRVRAGWELRPDVRRSQRARRPAFGWAAQYTVGSKAPASLSLSQFPLVPLAVLLELAAWVLLAGAVIGRPGESRRRPQRRRRRSSPPSTLSEAVAL